MIGLTLERALRELNGTEPVIVRYDSDKAVPGDTDIVIRARTLADGRTELTVSRLKLNVE